MSPAADKQKGTSAKGGKLGGKEFEEAFKPNGKAAAEGAEGGKKGKKGKLDKAGKKKKPKILVVIIVILVLLVMVGGAGAFLYMSGNLNKLIDQGLRAVGLQLISSQTASPSPSASTSPDVAETSPGASPSPQASASISPVQPSASGALTSPGVSPTVSPGVSASASPSAGTTQSFESLRSSFSDEKLTELKQVGTIYSKMDAAAAAAIMTKIYDVKQIAVIVYYMQPAASAQVLAKLDPTVAANVTKLMTS